MPIENANNVYIEKETNENQLNKKVNIYCQMKVMPVCGWEKWASTE